MYNFISFLERRDDDLWFRHYETISEMSLAELEARKPKDGLWYRDWETDRKSTRLNSSH